MGFSSECGNFGCAKSSTGWIALKRNLCNCNFRLCITFHPDDEYEKKRKKTKKKHNTFMYLALMRWQNKSQKNASTKLGDANAKRRAMCNARIAHLVWNLDKEMASTHELFVCLVFQIACFIRVSSPLLHTVDLLCFSSTGCVCVCGCVFFMTRNLPLRLDFCHLFFALNFYSMAIWGQSDRKFC